MSRHSFGGDWTVEKLNILSEYLDFYIIALKNQPFNKIYIDAFAGTGYINVGGEEEVIEGSVKLALKAANPFDRYIFIEKNNDYAKELNALLNNEFSHILHSVSVRNEDCNTALKNICEKTDWRRNRALIFLDPYATELEWETLKIIAATKAIDVWYLFPLSAANWMLKKDGRIQESWRIKLNRIFGDDGWFEEFYKADMQMTFFDEGLRFSKEVNEIQLKKYIYGRLKTIFPAVADNPRILYNTKNSPLFLFCFAVSNNSHTAIRLALKGADHILKYSGK